MRQDSSRAAGEPKHVLVVALSFPPSAAAAAIPTTQLACHLADYGWFPTVLTVHASRLRVPHAEGQGYPLPLDRLAVRRTDIVYRWDALRRLLPRGGSAAPQAEPVTSAPAPVAAPRRGPWLKALVEHALKLPDEFCGWRPFAVRAGRAVARERRVDCLYTVGPPMTGHVIGLRLHRVLRCPWVADFHDPWLANPWHSHDRPWPLPGLEARLERAVFRTADHIIAKTPEMADLFSQGSGRPRSDFTVVPCAYDAAEIAAAAADPLPASDKLVVIHTGSFYGPRSPGPLLHAMAQVAADPEFANRLELRLVGRPSPGIAALASRLGIARQVQEVGLVSHHDTLRHLLASRLAVVVQPGTGVQVPTKLYEYLGCGVPVLALTGEGATARVVRETRGGLVAPSDDVPGIAAALRTGLHQAEALRVSMDREAVGEYEASAVVGRAAALLDRLCR